MVSKINTRRKRQSFILRGKNILINTPNQDWKDKEGNLLLRQMYNTQKQHVGVLLFNVDDPYVKMTVKKNKHITSKTEDFCFRTVKSLSNICFYPGI